VNDTFHRRVWPKTSRCGQQASGARGKRHFLGHRCAPMGLYAFFLRVNGVAYKYLATRQPNLAPAT